MIFINIGRIASDMFIYRLLFLFLRDKPHHLGLMFDSIAKNPPGDIPFDHFIVPFLFQFSGGYIYLPNMILSFGLIKCMYNALLLYFFLKLCMTPLKSDIQVSLQFNGHDDISTQSSQ